jgi:hypothetical protein
MMLVYKLTLLCGVTTPIELNTKKKKRDNGKILLKEGDAFPCESFVVKAPFYGKTGQLS